MGAGTRSCGAAIATGTAVDPCAATGNGTAAFVFLSFLLAVIRPFFGGTDTGAAARLIAGCWVELAGVRVFACSAALSAACRGARPGDGCPLDGPITTTRVMRGALPPMS